MKIIGHRGAAGLAPENSIASLKKALEYRVDGVEFDLRLTKDDVIILHHDEEVQDQNGNKFKIANSTYENLKGHKPDLATFDEALSAINNAVKMYIEIKPGVKTSPIIKKVKAVGLKPNDYEFGSFSQPVLSEIQRAIPEASLTVIERWSGLRAVRKARKLKTKTIAMNQKYLWFGFIWLMNKSGYELWAYTVNDPKRAKKWAGWGLAGVTTDYPDRFIQ